MSLQFNNKRADLQAVQQFWDENPLFFGEAKSTLGERQFFEEHRRIAILEQSGKIDSIFYQDIHPGRKVIDVGCGIGFWVHELTNRDIHVIGCDISLKSAQITKKRIDIYELDAETQVANAEGLPYARNTFDHVNCQGVIHHTPNTFACIREFHRILKPGGTLCFSVYLKIWLFEHRPIFKIVLRVVKPFIKFEGRGREVMLSAQTPEELVRQYDGINNPIGKSFSIEQIKMMLSDYFDILEVRRMGFPRRVLPLHLSDSIHKQLSNHFGLMVVFRCTKI